MDDLEELPAPASDTASTTGSRPLQQFFLCNIPLLVLPRRPGRGWCLSAFIPIRVSLL